MRAVPPWLGELVKVRIERLRLLGLDGQPLGRAMGQVTVIWAEVLARRLAQPAEALDAARVHAAFDALERTCDRWPAPAQLLAALPRRTPPTALPPPRPDQARARAQVQQLLQQILRRDGQAATDANARRRSRNRPERKETNR